jgi:hypothetical protein
MAPLFFLSNISDYDKKIVLNRNEESGVLVLFLILQAKLSTVRYSVVGLSHLAFMMLRYSPY